MNKVAWIGLLSGVVCAGAQASGQAASAIGHTAPSRLNRVLHAYGTYPHEH